MQSEHDENVYKKIQKTKNKITTGENVTRK